MRNENTPVKSTANIVLGIASFGAGAYHGFCDAQNIPIEKEGVEAALTYAPAIVQGAFLATYSGIAKLTKLDSEGFYEKAERASAVTGATIGGGLAGGLTGGIETLVGYGIGYLAGSIFG